MRNIYKWKSLAEGQLELPRPSTTANRLIAVDGLCNEIYCPTANKWKVISGLDCRRYGSCYVFLGCELFILGGTKYDNNEAAVSRINKG